MRRLPPHEMRRKSMQRCCRAWSLPPLQATAACYTLPLQARLVCVCVCMNLGEFSELLGSSSSRFSLPRRSTPSQSMSWPPVAVTALYNLEPLPNSVKAANHHMTTRALHGCPFVAESIHVSLHTLRGEYSWCLYRWVYNCILHQLDWWTGSAPRKWIMHLNVCISLVMLWDFLQTSIDLSTSRPHNYLKSWWWSSSLRRSDRARFK